MLEENNHFQRHQSLIEGLQSNAKDIKTQFSQVYQDLYTKIQKQSSKIKFNPIIDLVKYKTDQMEKTKKVTKKLQRSNSLEKIQILNMPSSTLPKVREATKQQRKNIKLNKLQADKFVVNQTIYIHQKRRLLKQKVEKQSPYQKTSVNSFRSILSQRSKKLTQLSKKGIYLQNPEVQVNNYSDDKILPFQRSNGMINSQLNQKILRLNNTKIQFKKNKLIQTILEAEQNKMKQNQELKKIQLSQQNLFSLSFIEQKMIGSNIKPSQADKMSPQGKKSRWKSVQKIYSIKQQLKAKNLTFKKKVNWKTVPFPLIKIQKVQLSKIFKRYLRMDKILAPSMGFYKFFIGQGNNSQIIKQCLKSRGYWIQVETLNEKPNFVWTQLPSEQFYQQQTKFIEYQNVPRSSSIELTQANQKQLQSFFKFHECDYIKGCRKILPGPVFKRFLSQIMKRFKKGSKINQYLSIQKYTKQFVNEFKGKQFSNLTGLKVIKEKQDNITASLGTTASLIQQETAYKSNQIQLQNHFKKSNVIGNKKGLYHVFDSYCKSNNQNINDFIPPTIHIPFGNDLTIQKIKQLIQNEIPEGPWLIKPGQDTNRGNGIIIVQVLSNLFSQIKRRNQQYVKRSQGQKISDQQNQKQKSVIIQKYIEPFLYNKRKFDIRMWVLWSKNQLWWYKQGYLRTSSKDFSLKSISRFVHLTNDAVQINSQDYGKYQPANKLSFSEFQKYLQQQNSYQDQNNQVKIDFNTKIYGQMKDLTKKLFMMSKKELFENTLNFELFGLDFLVGKNLKVWLIQCNTNPSLEVHCSLQSRLIPNLIDNMLSIVIDPLFPCPEKRIGKQWTNALWNQQNFKFELLLDADQQYQQSNNKN